MGDIKQVLISRNSPWEVNEIMCARRCIWNALSEQKDQFILPSSTPLSLSGPPWWWDDALSQSQFPPLEDRSNNNNTNASTTQSHGIFKWDKKSRSKGSWQILGYSINYFELIFVFNLKFKIILAFWDTVPFVIQAAMEAKLLLVPFSELYDGRWSMPWPKQHHF